MDIDEDGTLDIAVQRTSDSNLASRSLTFIKNNFFNDAFFLKAMGESSLAGRLGAVLTSARNKKKLDQS